MKNFFHSLCLLTGLLIFSGCPYESTVPIDVPAMRINPQLVGTWNDLKNKDVYIITKKDEFTYSIEKKTKQPDQQKIEKYIAYSSSINGTVFLNVREIKSTEEISAYSFFKMEVDNKNAIIITAITDNIREMFSSSEELKKFIAGNMKNSYFFDKESITLTN